MEYEMTPAMMMSERDETVGPWKWAKRVGTAAEIYSGGEMGSAEGKTNPSLPVYSRTKGIDRLLDEGKFAGRPIIKRCRMFQSRK